MRKSVVPTALYKVEMNDVSFRIISWIEKSQKSENPETFKAFFTKDIIIRRIVKIIIRRFD